MVLLIFYSDEKLAHFTLLQNKERAVCCFTVYIIDFMWFWQLFHISNMQIDVSPSEKVRGLPNTHSAGQSLVHSSPSPDKASDAGPGILQFFPWLFGDANKQEANWSRPQTPREPTRTSTFWPGIRDTEPLYYLSSVELDQQECITSRFQEKQTLLLAEDQPRAEGTPRAQRMEKSSAWLSGPWVSLCTWVTLI